MQFSNAVARQVSEKIAPCKFRGWLAIFLFRAVLLEVDLQRIAATCNVIAQCITPSATVLSIFETLSPTAHAQSFFRLFLHTVI